MYSINQINLITIFLIKIIHSNIQDFLIIIIINNYHQVNIIYHKVEIIYHQIKINKFLIYQIQQ
jgi:hypothetical protein